MARKQSGHTPKASLAIKRVYAPAATGDGTRILVDRLWPRGVAKDKAKIDIWLKDIAPSDALRRRVHASEDAWDAFVVDYGHELAQEPAASAAQDLLARIRRGPVTLVYAARDETRNNASALKTWLQARLRRAPHRRRAKPQVASHQLKPVKRRPRQG